MISYPPIMFTKRADVS